MESGTSSNLPQPQARQLTSAEIQQFEDMRWAEEDSEVLKDYEGLWVVPYQKKIVATGSDVRSALEAAVQATGLAEDALPCVLVSDPAKNMLADFSPDTSFDFGNKPGE